MSEVLTLAPTFLGRCRSKVQAEPVALELALGELLTRASGDWPMLALPPLDFIAHLAERAPIQDGAVTLAELRMLHVSDLYLACACQRRLLGALELFELHFLHPLVNYLRRSEPSQPVIDELCQTLREHLFVDVPAQPGHAPKPQKIGSYDGRGALKSWLRVVALRTALTRRRSEKRQREQPLDDSALAVLPLANSPELATLKQRHEADIKQAITEALATLPPDRQNVLRLHILDGLTLEKIAGLYRVNRSTVKRWVDDARARLLSDLRRRLQVRLRLPQQEIDSLVGLLRSQLDLSLSRIFKAATP